MNWNYYGRKKIEGVLIRSRARWYEMGEKIPLIF